MNCAAHAVHILASGACHHERLLGHRRSDVAMPSDRRIRSVAASPEVTDGRSAATDAASDADGSQEADSDGDECPLSVGTMTREQLVGVTALACKGPRLLTGNAEGRLLYQDFSAAAPCFEPDARRACAASEDQRTAGGGRFWYRPH